jgi:hypothetical protein
MTGLLARLGALPWGKAGAPKGAVDAVAGNRIAGWAAADGGVTVEAWLDGTCVGQAKPHIARPDVGNAFPNLGGAALSGFSIDLPQSAERRDVSELTIIARPQRRGVRPSTLTRRTLVSDDLARQLAQAPDARVPGPFPKPVIDAIAAHWPEACIDLKSVDGQSRFLDRLLWVMATPSLNSLPVFADYARYLRVTLAHCRFVEDHFPAFNPSAKAGANDFHCKPNSVSELFAIIHQLYVLKSWGVDGDFAEFGCFKGYSSSMLSFACAQLGIRMHIFDSFAGLPPAEGSAYEAGQYSGGLDEVRENIRHFGSLGIVEFHEGFFADTLRVYRPPHLMCLWMDVDLEVSARDLLVVADRIDPRGSVFSHECVPDIFRDGAITTGPHPDNPVYPLVAQFHALERPLTGHHVAGYTGAFWPIADGIPVIESVVLQRLMKSYA